MHQCNTSDETLETRLRRWPSSHE